MPSAWQTMKRFERKATLAYFKEHHIQAENMRTYKMQLSVIEGAFNHGITPEFRYHAQRERIKLKSVVELNGENTFETGAAVRGCCQRER